MTLSPNPFEEPLRRLAHRPWPLPAGRWRLRQRWYNLLFAHWPIQVAAMQALLPAGLVADTFDGSAWIGVVPFSMDQVHTRTLGDGTVTVPGTAGFHELNLRTYVRSRATGRAGVFFFSLDCTSPLAVLGARTVFHLRYFLADIQVSLEGERIDYRSVRRFAHPARVHARYTPVGPVLESARAGTLEHFLTERYALFTKSFGRLLVGEIHHMPWPLQAAEAEFPIDTLAQAHGLTLPGVAPVLHFSRELYVNLWSLRGERETLAEP